MNLKFILLLFLIFPAMTFAEYRVYEYLIKNEGRDAVTTLSTLDPISYKAYNGGSRSVKIDLLRTWMCPGYTGEKKEYCKSPYQDLLEKEKNAN